LKLKCSQRLDLFANVLRCKTLPNIKTRHSDLDILIIRENTEGEYSNLEHESVNGVVESLKIVTREKSMRIAEFAFELAHLDGRKKVTAVHKANIMKLGDGLFLECCREVAKRYPDIKFETMIVDNTCMQLVAKPQQFDVMVMPNLYGNIVANVCTGLVGGAGVVAGSNYSSTCAVFEKGTRNSGKGIAGQNSANPSGMLFAAANMLKYIGYFPTFIKYISNLINDKFSTIKSNRLEQHGSVIKNAVVNTISKHNIKTADIGGTATTTEFMKQVIDEVQLHTPEIGKLLFLVIEIKR
jgi:isocitrate dehydrogenase (NAD+)